MAAAKVVDRRGAAASLGAYFRETIFGEAMPAAVTPLISKNLNDGGYLPIESYGIIGDLNTVALVGINGSIDFLSFPHFDSPSIFASLLDKEKGGHFQISPTTLGASSPRQLYIPDTNILMTRFLQEDGIVEVSDFMVISDNLSARAVVRRVKTVKGSVDVNMVCKPKFDYARAGHRVEQNRDGIFFYSEGKDDLVLRLYSEIKMSVENGMAKAQFQLSSGHTAYFVLEIVEAGGKFFPCDKKSLLTAFFDTATYWRRWIARSSYNGRWLEVIHRSALTLKLLTSKDYGSIVAAATFGLPEELKGERNWDYRYTWIRDASFTLYGLIRLGYTDEAAKFMHWIEERCYSLNPDQSLQIMYGINGRKNLKEETLSHFEGYKGSSPVRIGNGAYDQLQLDIYGELMDSVYLYDKYGEPISFRLWQALVGLIQWVCKNWRLSDEGIWEVRGGKKEFLYSRLMCWVALDRAIRLANKRSLPAPLAEWMQARDAIHKEIHTNFFSAKRRAFVQHKGSETIDAANLLMPMVKFISPTDPLWLSTLQAIEEDLVEDSLVYRYRIGNSASDGLSGDEGTFSMCSFWYVECLARCGQLEKARFYFEKMLGYANHLGLYAEELGPRGEHLGNFPQAFTHLGLISAGVNLNHKLSKRH